MPYLAAGDFDIAYHYKGGSTSLRTALGMPAKYSGRHMPRQGVKDIRLILRNPRDRLNSWLKMKKREYPHTFSAEQEVKKMLNGHNPHWNPVIPAFTRSGVLVPTSVVRLEDIEAWWPVWFPDVPLRHENKTESEDLIGPYIHYFDISHKEDYDVWNAISSGMSLRLTPGNSLGSWLGIPTTLTDTK